MKNKKIIKKILKKDEKGLELLIDEYGWIVKTVVFKHLFNFNSLQEECINDIFLSISNNLKDMSELNKKYEIEGDKTFKDK